ncbi:hydrogen peroxide-inducible genes activator [Antarctobacter heliothermus]|uniref:LysR family transcriptional regulator, hydrogen peroxide-inducible genes activator n=1 Tax=Antarctobacter heliothermus TaxID=74033 RepID=A0A239JH54_9RHOB|nr:hydrogen peroxide-inducible genes activator [Antarctobacter heliothermus]SNT04922.1 LysR family transcriptional regulator, hydrogen peroxide-inducible genes activator [Antarctobacter heliothermus]
MKNLTLRQLRYFEALSRHGHFGRAAAACSISQPALSVQIRDLEADLGAPLFERGARQVRLTALGEACLERAVKILRAVDELEDLARAAQGDLVGRLRLGVIPTVAPYLLPALFAELAQSHAGLDLHIRETMTPRLLSELHEGRIDCAILALPVGEPGLDEVALFDEVFVFVRPEAETDHPVPDGEALQKMRLLLLEEGHCFRDQALSFCKLNATTPRDGLDGSSLTTLVQMVGAGLGVTLIPEMAVPVETPSARVAVARFSDPEPARTIGMVWRRSSPLSDQFQRLADTVRRAAAARA